MNVAVGLPIMVDNVDRTKELFGNHSLNAKEEKNEQALILSTVECRKSKYLTKRFSKEDVAITSQ